MEPLLLILLSLLSTATISASPLHQSIIAISAPLDPNQIRALQTMKVPISYADPCSDPAIVCNDGTHPFRYITSLKHHNCPYNLSISPLQLKNLSTLKILELINCPFDTNISSSPLSLILENLKNLTTLTISNSSLTESLPEKWDNLNLTHIDLSYNQLKGKIPISLGYLTCLQTLSLASNSLEGNVPSFVRYMKGLRYLNLNNNTLDNDNCAKGSLWSTGAVQGMAFMLSIWIAVIAFVMLLANCGPY